MVFMPNISIMLFNVYTTTLKRFVIFTCRYFKLSWNTTALNQSNCSNFSCGSINWEIFVLLLHHAPRTPQAPLLTWAYSVFIIFCFVFCLHSLEKTINLLTTQFNNYASYCSSMTTQVVHNDHNSSSPRVD